MPKSRKRKKNKSPKPGQPAGRSPQGSSTQASLPQEEALRALRGAMHGSMHDRPPWFDAATERVLTGVYRLIPATDERELAVLPRDVVNAG